MSNSTQMENDRTMTVQRSSYIPGCMMSPSCLPIHNEFQYSRIHYCNSPRKRVQRWRNILRRFMRERKTLCRSKPLSFQYDPVSYSQNFDEGCHLDEPRPGLQDRIKVQLFLESDADMKLEADVKVQLQNIMLALCRKK
ncbi:hypothetical protein CR513_14019, partial [Mucuna pruriens]